MNKTIDEINDYLKSINWKWQKLWQGDFYVQKNWNSYATDDLAFEWYNQYLDDLSNSIAREFQSKQSIGVCNCGKCPKCLYS